MKEATKEYAEQSANDYGERAYSGHFAGDDPDKHFLRGYLDALEKTKATQMQEEIERLKIECTYYKSLNGEEDPLLLKDIQNHNRLHGVINDRNKEIQSLTKKLELAAERLNEIKSMCDGNITNENNIWHRANKTLKQLKE